MPKGPKILLYCWKIGLGGKKKVIHCRHTSLNELMPKLKKYSHRNKRRC